MTTFDDDEISLSEDWDPTLDFNFEQMPLPKVNRNNKNSELFALNNIYNSLDECIDDTMTQNGEMFSLVNHVRGHKQNKRRKTRELKPMVFVQLNTRAAGKPKPVTIRALLDSGGSGTLLTEKYAKKLKLKQSSSQQKWTTPAGELSTSRSAKAEFIIPELHDNRMITWKVHVTKDLGAYDMIIGRDILTDLGIDIRFSTETIEWDDSQIPFKDMDAHIHQSYHVDDPHAVDEASERLKHILDAKYEAADLGEVCREQKQLSDEEQKRLQSLLEKHSSLFDGTLGNWRGQEHHLELRPDVKPYHARAFPIPHIHTDTLKVEVERLCELGVLKKVNRSEWAAPTFIIPKKDGSVRFISDFRELNKRIKRKPFPIPKIQDLLVKLEGFQYATSLDLNMGYYHIELSPQSKRLCTIVLPFGKYEYQRLPMGLCNSPDIFQEGMSELMADLEYVRVYIDDLLCLTSGDFSDHLQKLDEVLTRLGEAGLKVNAKKSFFARGELEYLGYWITRDGIQPLPDKVAAIHKLKPPKNRTELRSFIGIVNYYRDMWIRRSHVLAPLAKLTSKGNKWQWGQEEQHAFDTMKKIIAKETLLAYPDFSKPFEIHTDASHYQLGAVISQSGKPIAFYSRKLNPAQTRYTTTERELLSIVETLKEFRNILLGHQVTVYTDHKNLTYKNFNTERVMRWRLILEEYGPELRYIKGPHNVVADALSRLDLDDDVRPLEINQYAELFASEDDDGPDVYPLRYSRVYDEQQKDEELQKRYFDSELYEKKPFKAGDKTYDLITREDKIVLPKSLQEPATRWYHELLAHPGETRTELTIGQHFHWKGMRKTVQHICGRCPQCQLAKPKKNKYGLLPEKDAEIIPWECVCIDLIGPYEIGKGKNKIILHCLTMIDPATGWFEIAEIPSKRADDIANIFEQVWLSRYPWPQQVILDRGREFMAEVKTLLKNEYGVTRKAITTRNPQANAMVERAHQTLHNMIRVQQIKGKDDLPDGSWTGILTAIAFAMRATVHTTTRATPTQLVFNRDAMHNVRFEADWKYIKERKQRLIRQNLKRENKNRIPHTYAVNDQVAVKQDPSRKHGEDRYRGPYRVTHVFPNGTVRLEQSTPSGGVVNQTWNIRNVVPYKA